MIGVFNTITINGTEVFRPNDMQMEREDVYAGEYTTMTGKVIADRIGWKYSDMDLSWDTLTLAMIDALTGVTGPFNLTFTDSDGTHTEAVIRRGFSNVPTRFTSPSGEACWKNVKVKVRFINVHND